MSPPPLTTELMLKASMDVLSMLTLVGWWTDALPHLATLFTVLWGAIRLWETDTIQKMVKWLRRPRV